jgi:predicted XRE-type DNA-binding protein
VVEKQIDKFKDIKNFRARVLFLENEARQIRLLTQQQIMDQKASASLSITKPEVQEIIMKFTFDMLDHVVNKLEDEIKVNVNT